MRALRLDNATEPRFLSGKEEVASLAARCCPYSVFLSCIIIFFHETLCFQPLKLRLPADFGGYQTPQTVDLEWYKRELKVWAYFSGSLN